MSAVALQRILLALLKKGRRTAMPTQVAPMLCSLIRKPFHDEEYLHELKLDGYRILAYASKGRIRLDSRGGLDYTRKYPPVVEALQKINHELVMDGEVVVLNKDGIPDFDTLQNYNVSEHTLFYFVFDLLWMEGYSLMELPLEQRKQLLQAVVTGNATIRYTEHFADGLALFEQIQERGMEGIVSKRKMSRYQPGVRGHDWYKIPAILQQEFVIGGWATSQAGRAFKSLLLGAYNHKKQFEWIGRSGGGFKDKEMPGILRKLKALEIKKSPFINPVLDTKGAEIHYVKPQLVGNFAFAAWTKSGRIRKPATFLGLRQDKKATDVVREMPVKLAAVADIDPTPATKKTGGDADVQKQPAKQIYLNKESNWKKVDQEVIKERATVELDDCTIALTNVSRKLWENVTKAQLIQYYHAMAPYILPHLQDRPESLNLKLRSAGAGTTFIKDMENRQPDCAMVFTDQRRIENESKRKVIEYLVCNNEATLLYMVNLGCVDINPWSSRWQQPNQPDYIWLDLDPSIPDTAKDKTKYEEAGFKKAIETALATQEVLRTNKLVAYIKTSGKTGLHVYIPCTGFTHVQTRSIAEQLAANVHAMVPRITTLAKSITARKDKLYIDAGQNDYADTLAAPYSVRPYHQPLVSTPLEWKEVKPTLDRYAFTIDSIQQRIAKKGDVFAGAIEARKAQQNTKQLGKYL